MLSLFRSPCNEYRKRHRRQGQVLQSSIFELYFGLWHGHSVSSSQADFTTSPRAGIAAKRSILTSKTARIGSLCWVKSAPTSTGAASITDSAKTADTLREAPRAQRRPLAKPIAHFERTYPTRHEAMARAFQTGVYTMQEIADYFGARRRSG